MSQPLEKPMRFKEVQDFLGVGHNYLYEALQSGRLKGYKLGNRWIVYPSDLKNSWTICHLTIRR